MADILVVDDKQDITDLVKMIFEVKGGSVQTAFNGREAIDMLKAHGYDVVLMDLMMPDINGYEALKIIRKDHALKDTVVIACTARASKQDEETVLAAGFNDYISKPFRVQHLEETVNKYVH
ncbi:MAG: response regulator [Candidatus Margulisiibacteriota bacterium]